MADMATAGALIGLMVTVLEGPTAACPTEPGLRDVTEEIVYFATHKDATQIATLKAIVRNGCTVLRTGTRGEGMWVDSKRGTLYARFGDYGYWVRDCSVKIHFVGHNSDGGRLTFFPIAAQAFEL
jgi:hypothetical protein